MLEDKLKGFIIQSGDYHIFLDISGEGWQVAKRYYPGSVRSHYCNDAWYDNLEAALDYVISKTEGSE